MFSYLKFCAHFEANGPNRVHFLFKELLPSLSVINLSRLPQFDKKIMGSITGLVLVLEAHKIKIVMNVILLLKMTGYMKNVIITC